MIKPDKPLVLASASKVRADMLRAAGVDFRVVPADIDETQYKTAADLSARMIAVRLAEEKALHISRQQPSVLVIGADQVLECGGILLSKAKDKNQAREKLLLLRGRTHELISAAAIACGGKILWSFAQSAKLTMHDFDDNFLDEYINRAGDALTRSVGAYELESLGVQLFDRIEGDYFTILGLPLLAMLKFFREEQLS